LRTLSRSRLPVSTIDTILTFDFSASIMRLVFLGTTGYHPNNQRHTACMMIPELGLILDAGTGLFRARDLIETDRLMIFLSHAHLDHVIGLTYMFDVLYEKSVRQVLVYGEQEKLSALNDHLFSPLLFPIKPPFEMRPLKQNPIEFSPGNSITYFPLDHPGGSLGFRLKLGNLSLAYVTDTVASPTAKYVEAIRGADILIHECYFPDGYEDKAQLTGHSCVTPVLEVARTADVGKLYLVHVNPLAENDDCVGLEKSRGIFPRSEIATDGQIIRL
jgi:ribonuclease Z